MKRLCFIVGLIGALLFPTLSLAKEVKTDHTPCEEMDTDAAVPLWTKGQWIATACILLCDGYAAADTGAGCVEWDFNDFPGMPDMIILEYEQESDDDCGANVPQFTIATGPMSNGTLTSQTNASYVGDPTYEIGSSAVVIDETNPRVTILTETAPLDRYIFVTQTGTDTNCTDIDIRMFFYSRKTNIY
jgi:hypothetical protein